MGDKDETWRQKICFQQSPLLLLGALCRDGLQKEFDRHKARSCENAVLSIFTWSDQNEEVSQRSESKNPWGQNDQVIRRSFGYGNRERIWYV